MKVKLGDIVEINGIKMTCTCRKEFFNGWQHHFMYFSCGELREYQFWEDELDALRARYVGNKFNGKEIKDGELHE